MKLKFGLFALFLMLGPCAFAQAAQTAPPVEVRAFQSAIGLRDDCKRFIASTYVNGPVCAGYIQGAVDELNLTLMNYPVAVRACLPRNVTTEELVRVTLKYIDQHPEELSETAPAVVWAALFTYYPCGAK